MPDTRLNRHPFSNVNTKSVFLIVLLAFVSLFNDFAKADLPLQKTGDGWKSYPQIGLQLQLPDLKADIDDQNRMWSFWGYVANPVADVQYRVVISAHKCTTEQHLRWYPKSGTNANEWMNLQHLQTSQMTNAFWIYSRRDVFGPNGFAYFCEGRIKRDAHFKPKDVNHLDAEEEKLAEEVRAILDSIKILSTNSAANPKHLKSL